jgi:hypothetical protein
MMDMKIPTWFAVASGLTLKETLSKKAENHVHTKISRFQARETSTTDLMGEDGVTDSTGEISRPLETWFKKGPNLTRVQRSAEHIKGAWVWAVLQNGVRH